MTSAPISAQSPARTLSVVSQPVSLPLTRAAIFLVVTIKPLDENRAKVLSLCADLSALLRAVAFRNLEAGLSCIMGLGANAWDRLFGSPRPAELHPFREIRSNSRHAVSTPGDLIFHVRAKNMDLCFELAAQIIERLGDAVTTVDEVHGFRYFDNRDLLGFVDGTENPTGGAAAEAVLVGEEDSVFAGGSYVIVQKYLHNLDAWNALPTEAQEKIIGRKKVSDIELDDSVKPSCAHNALTTIEENGKEIKILRDNMPFGRPGHGEPGSERRDRGGNGRVPRDLSARQDQVGTIHWMVWTDHDDSGVFADRHMVSDSACQLRCDYEYTDHGRGERWSRVYGAHWRRCVWGAAGAAV